MNFLNPTLATVGLACIAIPIIIHILMRRRRRPVQWAAMKFLIEAYRRQRRRMNLEQILLLASRCLLVALLAVALGKPVLGALGVLEQGPRTLYLLIDNGLASSATNPGDTKPALDKSKDAALDLLSKLDQSRGDRVALLSLAGPSEALVVPPTADLSAAGEVIRGLHPLDSRTDISGALAKVRDELRRAPLKTGEALWLAVLSDFRAGSTDLEATISPISQGEGEVHLLAQTPAESRADNIMITAVEPARSVLIATAEPGTTPSTTTPVRVTLRRSGPGVASTAVTTVNLAAVGVSPNASNANARTGRAQVTVTWRPGDETVVAATNIEVPITAQGLREPVTITATIDRDLIGADNSFRRPIDTRDRLEAALLAPGSIGGKGTIDTFTPADWLALALSPEADPMRRRQSGEVRVSALDPARVLAPLPGSRNAAGMLADYDAILVPRPELVDPAGWRLVRAAVDLGALVVISPPADEQTHTWSDAMTEGLGLDWQVSRETHAFTPPAPLAADRPTPAGPDLLNYIDAELPDLLKHVNVSKALTLTGPNGGFDTLLRLADGSPFLVSSQPGSRSTEKGAKSGSRGLILFFTASPDLKWTDLPTKPLMVPLIQELVRQGVGRSSGSRTAIAGLAPAVPSGTVELAPIHDPAAAPDAPTPPTIGIDGNGRFSSPVRTQGLWNARTSAGISLGVLAFNADTTGGLTDTRTREEVARWLSPLAGDITWVDPGTTLPGGNSAQGATLTRENKVPPISFPLLVAALVVGIIETGLARWFSHAKAESGLIRATASAKAAFKGADAA